MRHWFTSLKLKTTISQASLCYRRSRKMGGRVSVEFQPQGASLGRELKKNNQVFIFLFLLVLWEFHKVHLDYIHPLSPFLPDPSHSLPRQLYVLFFLKTHQVQFMHLDVWPSLGCGLHTWGHKPLKKMGPPPSSYQKPSSARGGTCAHHPSMLGFCLAWTCAGLRVLSQPPWVHVCNRPPVSKIRHSFVATCCSYILSPVFGHHQWALCSCCSSSLWWAVGLCIHCRLQQRETSLMRVDQCTNLWVWWSGFT